MTFPVHLLWFPKPGKKIASAAPENSQAVTGTTKSIMQLKHKHTSYRINPRFRTLKKKKVKAEDMTQMQNQLILFTNESIFSGQLESEELKQGQEGVLKSHPWTFECQFSFYIPNSMLVKESSAHLSWSLDAEHKHVLDWSKAHIFQI